MLGEVSLGDTVAMAEPGTLAAREPEGAAGEDESSSQLCQTGRFQENNVLFRVPSTSLEPYILLLRCTEHLAHVSGGNTCCVQELGAEDPVVVVVAGPAGVQLGNGTVP